MGTRAHQECDGCGADTGYRVGFCPDCEAERAAQLRKFEAVTAGDTHGSPELDEDARKLEAMGQDAGPTLAQISPQTRDEYTASMFLIAGMFMGTMTRAGVVGPIPADVANELRVIAAQMRDLYTRSKIAEASDGE